jgi:hypothetical protein
MTARPTNLRRAAAPVLLFYRRELAVKLVEELLVAEASRSLKCLRNQLTVKQSFSTKKASMKLRC